MKSELDQEEIRLWAQMFFADGAVSEACLRSSYAFSSREKLEDLSCRFLVNVGREEGVLLIWGGGVIKSYLCELIDGQIKVALVFVNSNIS